MGGIASKAKQNITTPKKQAEAEAKAEAVVKQTVEQHAVVVFSKRTCGYCDAVKSVLARETRLLKARDGCLDVPQVAVIELDELFPRPQNMTQVQQALANRTGIRTVPQVFINQRFVGGAEDTARLASTGGLRVALMDVSKCTPRDD